ncbi:glycosyltransferase family 4 protein [Halomicrobium sp. LC1Hm]|uniref:glycosyltransferase family 4 protein n=1 Tax=Halomicrobium sp. LC1Hm TaxID=2610902 RepID=UPI0012985183|nr:glycosyltransferase family 4 protein [Halomicrobium sp. LC1Hm]QGA81910.1 Glycosyltransferase [Halomicrobium sp. LC1Hm]
MSEKFALITDTFLGNPSQYSGVEASDMIGGAEVNLYRIAQILLEEGHEVTVYQKDTGNPNNEYDGIKIEYLPTIGSGTMELLSFNIQWQRALAQDEIVYVHSPEYAIPDLKPVDALNQQGITWDAPSSKDLKTRVKRYFLGRQLSKTLVRCTDNAFLTYVQSEHPTARNNVFPIPNGVDTTIFSQDVDPVKNSTNQASEETVILFPRTLRLARGAHLIVDALAELRSKGYDVSLWFLGAENITDASSIRSQIERNDLSEVVEFLGHVPHKEMPHYYAAADIVAIPTYHSEGTSLSCLEAMACGRPVVVTDIGGLKEIIYQDKVDGGFKVKPTGKALATAIERLVEDPVLRDNLGENARQRVVNYFTLERWEQQMREFFCMVSERHSQN